MRTAIITKDNRVKIIVLEPKINKWFRFDPRMKHGFRYEVFWNWSQCIKGRGPTDQEESDWHNMMSGCEL